METNQVTPSRHGGVVKDLINMVLARGMEVELGKAAVPALDGGNVSLGEHNLQPASKEKMCYVDAMQEVDAAASKDSTNVVSIAAVEGRLVGQ